MRIPHHENNPNITLSKIEFFIFTNHSEDDEMGNSICGNFVFFSPCHPASAQHVAH